MPNPNRRTVLKQSAALALTAGLPASEALAQTAPLRRPVSAMAPSDPILVSYRLAVRRMKETLPTSDPRNWTRQAQIHQTFCPHNNWFFLPWHRAYLVAFERICRQLSGNPNFALPYWDWTANPQLPAAFASPTIGSPPVTNPLYDSTRSSQTVTMPTNNTGPTVISNILAETSFEFFGSSRPTGQNSTSPSWQRVVGITGPFEGNPHNSVHGSISGNMGGYMSPLDPIFWLHHCNVDRIWDRWNRMGRANTSNALWRNFRFDKQFVVPSGSGTTAYNVAVNELLNINALGYTYTPTFTLPPWVFTQFNLIPRPIDLNRLPPLALVTNVPAARLNVPLDLTVNLNAAQNSALARIRPTAQLEDTSKAVQAPGRIVAIIRDIEPPKNTSFEVRVFVNHPNLSPDTPTGDRHYAGSFNFFGTDHAEHGGSKPSYLIDLTTTVLRLRQSQPEFKDQITVQLLPVPVPGGPREGIEFKPGRVEVAIV